MIIKRKIYYAPLNRTRLWNIKRLHYEQSMKNGENMQQNLSWIWNCLKNWYLRIRIVMKNSQFQIMTRDMYYSCLYWSRVTLHGVPCILILVSFNKDFLKTSKISDFHLQTSQNASPSWNSKEIVGGFEWWWQKNQHVQVSFRKKSINR